MSFFAPAHHCPNLKPKHMEGLNTTSQYKYIANPNDKTSFLKISVADEYPTAGTKSKKERSKWFKSLTPEQQKEHIKKCMAKKAALRSPEYRLNKYRQRGYSEAEIKLIMGG